MLKKWWTGFIIASSRLTNWFFSLIYKLYIILKLVSSGTNFISIINLEKYKCNVVPQKYSGINVKSEITYWVIIRNIGNHKFAVKFNVA